MLKVVITNKLNFCREVQYFRSNQWKVVASMSSVEFTDIDENDFLKINYYKSLEKCNFEVSFINQESNEQEECAKKCEDTQEETVESTESCENECSTQSTQPSMSDLSDDQIRQIIDNLGISTRLRSRWKLEQLIEESLPEGKVFSDYL